jgi:hypothetical protein
MDNPTKYSAIRIELAKMIVKYVDATMIIKSFERQPLDNLYQAQVTLEDKLAFDSKMESMQNSMDPPTK